MNMNMCLLLVTLCFVKWWCNKFVLFLHKKSLPWSILCCDILYSSTVEPRYNEDLGTMKITLLYQGKKNKYKELGPAKIPCYKRVLLYPTSL